LRNRKLRIAFSVVCGIACLLLIAFWLRGHYRVEQLIAPIGGSEYVFVLSLPNRFGFGVCDESPTNTWAVLSVPTDQWMASFYLNTGAPPAVLANQFSVDDGLILVPCWFGILLTIAASICPWLCWRFSLRTLLIATMLVAVALGIIVS
jgi:hypothetical protein